MADAGRRGGTFSRSQVDLALSLLDSDEENVVRMRHGVTVSGDHELDSKGAKVAAKNRIAQIEAKAVVRLRRS